MEQTAKGQLKIFFSYAEHVGKTRTMLKAARFAASQGAHVLAGCLTPQGELGGLPEGMDALEPLWIGDQPEFDLDRALSLRPDLVLVDELEHSNGPGCRHRKRYQDVHELLKNGIDVYTTVNVSSIESLHDTVAAITGSTTWERIPDDVFDQADQVELVDIEPEELMQRLRHGDSPSAGLSLEQLTALREIALRRCADRVRRLSERLQNARPFTTDEHILVCLSSAPSNAKIIRTAARMARAFNSQFTALFIETPDFAVISEDNKRRLQANQKLAAQLGANIEQVYGEDIPYQIAEFARLSGVTRIVLGRSSMTVKRRWGKPSLTEQLLAYVPEMDIHIIPDWNVDPSYRPRKASRYSFRKLLQDGATFTAVLAGATGLGLLFRHWGFSEANIIMLYILSVLLISVRTSRRSYSLLSSAAGVLLFDFLFIEPRYSLLVTGGSYPVTFAVMFLTACITGTFAVSYEERAGQAAKISYRTKILFDTDQMLSKVKDKNEIFAVTVRQIMKLLSRNIVVYDLEDGQLTQPQLFAVDAAHPVQYDQARELETVQWVLKNNHAAGATTDTLSGTNFLYLALRVNECVYGVVGIQADSGPLDASEHGILLSIMGECALALENEKNAREKEAAAILAESEQLRANLLRTISHDLRTPLTTISGNASNLISNGASFDEPTKQRLYTDIYDDAMWLINLVENLLSATRIEEGRMTLRMSTELLDDIVEEALRHSRRKAGTHQISAHSPEELLLVRADAKLIMQVLVNLVDNAVKYTPEGASIDVTTERRGEMALIRVSDTGSGIAPEDKARIFDKFYCGANKIADNRRSLGLGLYLCRAIVEAHGGRIEVTDNEPRGSVFAFTLPLEEVNLHE